MIRLRDGISTQAPWSSDQYRALGILSRHYWKGFAKYMNLNVRSFIWLTILKKNDNFFYPVTHSIDDSRHAYSKIQKFKKKSSTHTLIRYIPQNCYFSPDTFCFDINDCSIHRFNSECRRNKIEKRLILALRDVFSRRYENTSAFNTHNPSLRFNRVSLTNVSSKRECFEIGNTSLSNHSIKCCLDVFDNP